MTEQKLKVFQEGGRVCYLYPNYVFSGSAFKSHPFKIWENHIPIVSVSKNHKVNWYFLSNDESDFDYALERVLKDKDFFVKSDTEIIKAVSEFQTKITKVNFGEITDEELLNQYKDYINCYKYVGMYPTFLRQIDRAVVRQLRSAFQGHGEVDSMLATVAFPSKMSYGRQEEVAVFESIINYKEKFVPIAELALKLEQEFGSSSLGYFDEPAKDSAFYIAKIQELGEIDYKTELAKIKKEEADFSQAKLELKKDFSDMIAEIIDVAGKVVFAKDHYKFYINKLQFAGEIIFTEITKRKNISIGLLKDMTVTEVSSLLAGKAVDYDGISARIKNHAITTLEKETVILVGEEALKFEREHLTFDGSKTEFRGRIACKGQGMGKVRVILSPVDFGKMEQGDILVVMNTSPDFVPIMKKAKAIVAEEGGITGHVSVVSREFGIPCVVGIRNITELLKDGQMINVDADKGVVTLIK